MMKLELPESFFEEEVRCDFKITARMKQAWAAQLKMYVEIYNLCERHGIKLFAEVGTLLGAARHNGFVPWDDDIDLAMPRADYMRFIDVAVNGNELPKYYNVKSMYSDKLGTFSQFHTVVQNYDKKILEWDEERNKEFFGCPFICGIDIYPLDYVARNKNDREYLTKVYNLAYVMAMDYDSKKDEDDYIKNVAYLGNLLGGSFREDIPLREQLYQITDSIASVTKKEDSEFMDYYPKLVDGREHTLRNTEWFDEVIMLPFETVEIPVPAMYREALSRHYGNWKTYRVHAFAQHEYPFYRKQEELFILQGHLVEEQ